MRNFAIELAASVTTLAGMWQGSTTHAGAVFYIVAAVFWFLLMFRRRMWGLAPLNVAALAIAITNLARAACLHSTHQHPNGVIMSQLGMFSEDAAPTPRASAATKRRVDLKAFNAALGTEFQAKVARFVLGHLVEFGVQSGEDCVDAMQASGLLPPHGDGRSYGPAIQGMSVRGLIEPYGDGTRRKGNGTRGATIWRVTEKGRIELTAKGAQA